MPKAEMRQAIVLNDFRCDVALMGQDLCCGSVDPGDVEFTRNFEDFGHEDTESRA
jgi:hypothetical protein